MLHLFELVIGHLSHVTSVKKRKLCYWSAMSCDHTEGSGKSEKLDHSEDYRTLLATQLERNQVPPGGP